MERGTLVGLRAGGATLCGVAAVAAAAALMAGAAPGPTEGMVAVDPVVVDPVVVDPVVVGPVAVGPAIAFVASPGMRASYTWTGNGATDDWNVTGNWFSRGIGYPSSSADDANFTSTAVPVLEASHTIDDLSVTNAGVTFDAFENDRNLTCDTVTISGGAGAAELKATYRAGVETD
ncbi:MAG: hypothetical protein IT449_10235 [Phycisphaerales bacterium]|nr:hypothetical protein [Phycisphaerales bacterium]